MNRSFHSLNAQQQQVFQQLLTSSQPNRLFLQLYNSSLVWSKRSQIAFLHLPYPIIKNISNQLRQIVNNQDIYNVKNANKNNNLPSNQNQEQNKKQKAFAKDCYQFAYSVQNLIYSYEQRIQSKRVNCSCMFGFLGLAFIFMLMIWFVVKLNLNYWLKEDFQYFRDPISQKLQHDVIHYVRDYVHIVMKLTIGLMIMIPIALSLCCVLTCFKAYQQSSKFQLQRLNQFNRMIKEFRKNTETVQYQKGDKLF